MDLPGPARAVCHAAVGADLFWYAADADALTLVREGGLRAPEHVQYAWAHPVLPVLYAAYSNRSTADDHHGVACYRIEPATGRLTELHRPLDLPHRPIHLSVDPAGRFLLVASNQPSALVVHALEADGAIGERVEQPGPVDVGNYAHQVRTTPAGDAVVVCARGSDATATEPGAPGALVVFRFRDGRLSHRRSITVGDGRDFGPRHVDFHPTKPFVYVSLERGNQVLTHGVRDGGITPEPLHSAPTAARPDLRAPQQYLGPVHVHPSGRHLYLVNRSDGTVPSRGRAVHGEGENTVAVFALDPDTGEPTLAQTVGIDAFHARTFAIHPSGTMLVTAAAAPLAERVGDDVREVAAGFSVFGIGDDGRLTFARTYDVDVRCGPLFWCGMLRR